MNAQTATPDYERFTRAIDPGMNAPAVPLATRAAIIAKAEVGDSYRGILCHRDGYQKHTGYLLAMYYLGPPKVSRLIALGDIYYLRYRVAPNGETHSYATPEGGVTVACGRDRGDVGTEPETGDIAGLIAGYHERGIEYVYVFTGDYWLVNNVPVTRVLGVITSHADFMRVCPV